MSDEKEKETPPKASSSKNPRKRNAKNLAKGVTRTLGVIPVSQTIDLVYHDGPVVQATVVKDEIDNTFRLQLDYYADKEFIDEDGFMGVRWTKDDLRRMINMLLVAEGILNE